MSGTADRDGSVPAVELLRVSTLNALHSGTAVTERTALVIEELSVLRPDVFCLQEVRFEREQSSTQLQAISRETGLNVATGYGQHLLKDGYLGGIAILTRLPVIDTGHLPLGVPAAPVHSGSFAVLRHPSGRTVIVATAHLHWGGDKERERLTQATAIDAKIRRLIERHAAGNPMAVLTGDFNTTPAGDTARFLRGEGAGADGSYTYWTDAFEVAGHPAAATTVANDNPWAVETARGVGIRFPSHLPDRRIDYIWAYGWAYGKPGAPVALNRSFTDTSRFGFPASDHYGLTADFWTPAVAADIPAPRRDRVPEPVAA